MHPLVKATDIELTGTVDVSLTLGTSVALPTGTSLSGFSAVLTSSDDGSVKSLPLSSSGSVSFLFLTPGNYTLTFAAPLSVASFTTTPPIPVAVAVSSGQATTEAFVLSALSPAP